MAGQGIIQFNWFQSDLNIIPLATSVTVSASTSSTSPTTPCNSEVIIAIAIIGTAAGATASPRTHQPVPRRLSGIRTSSALTWIGIGNGDMDGIPTGPTRCLLCHCHIPRQRCPHPSLGRLSIAKLHSRRVPSSTQSDVRAAQFGNHTETRSLCVDVGCASAAAKETKRRGWPGWQAWVGFLWIRDDGLSLCPSKLSRRVYFFLWCNRGAVVVVYIVYNNLMVARPSGCTSEESARCSRNCKFSIGLEIMSPVGNTD